MSYMIQNMKNCNEITSTETFSTQYEYVCVRPADYYSSKCLNCTMREPVDCDYLRIKTKIKSI